MLLDNTSSEYVKCLWNNSRGSRIVSWVMGKTLYRLLNFCDVLYRSRGTVHNVMNIKG